MSEPFFHRRRMLAVIVHLLIWISAFFLAFFLRFEFSVPAKFFPKIWYWLPLLLGARLFVFLGSTSFTGLWRYSGTHDFFTTAKATAISTGIFMVVVLIGRETELPRTIYIIEAMLSVGMVAVLRFGVRASFERGRMKSFQPKGLKQRRVLIVGAGDAGEAICRELGRMADRVPVGFLDDKHAKLGMRIHGVPVLGPIDFVEAASTNHKVDEIVVAIPTATGAQMRRIVSLCSKTGLPIRTIPGFQELLDGSVTVSQLRDVAIDDLLGRDPVRLEMDAISASLSGKRVMVTGAGGSIGSELCRQVAAFEPGQLLLLERAENALYEIHRSLKGQFPLLEIIPVLADIGDASRLDAVFRVHRPEVVFHAAAHKHVPMLEANPGEGIRNNILGTKTLADAADRHEVTSFVMISTDKAVNASSVMGATKRVAELYVQALAGKSRTRYLTVRFGNVLGSNGSVVPLFREQIAKGGPITITHKDMVRYFMTIPEAAQLVLQAATMGKGGEIYVLDMGEPVKIVDLARDLIRLSGLREEDIEIVFSGMRPGEKLYEELSFDAEVATKTRHPKIFVGVGNARSFDVIEKDVLRLIGEAYSGNDRGMRLQIQSIVPEFTGVKVERVSKPDERKSRPSSEQLQVALKH